jgi:formate hydrogenlyase subunit 3/multisubunit Na+/H+ antiporter MnhD subunit
MSNAGVLGLLHFLPLQQHGYVTAGMVLLTFGLFGAFYGVLLGLPQRRPKIILAYSSVSQLGTLTAMIGLAMMAPELAPALIIAVAVYAVHHGLTKAALFLALDSVAQPRWRGLSIATLIVLSLMMAGLPYSSGAVAKGLMKSAIDDGYAWLVTLLAIAGIATALLMTRFLFACLAPLRRPNPASTGAGVGLALSLLVVAHVALYQAAPLPAMGLGGIWPLAIAMLLVVAYAMLPSRAHGALQPVIPKGDLPTVLANALLRLAARRPHPPRSWTPRRPARVSPVSITRSRTASDIADAPTGTGRNS